MVVRWWGASTLRTLQQAARVVQELHLQRTLVQVEFWSYQPCHVRPARLPGAGWAVRNGGEAAAHAVHVHCTGSRCAGLLLSRAE